MPMWIELFVAALLVLVTVITHGLGLGGLSWTLDKVHPVEANSHSHSKRAFAATVLTLGLVAICAVEIWVYAFFYVWAGAIPDLRAAVYFSTVTFSTLGFSDGAIIDRWKLVGAIEGINGAILVGWSVAFLVAEMTRHVRSRH